MKAKALNLNKDFRRLYACGKSNAHPLLVTYVRKNKENTLRVGITTSKKIGKAVARNRARRIIKASLIELMPDILEKNYDVVFVSRAKTTKAKMQDILPVMKKHLKNLGVL